jgi:hypothetical protein
LGTNWRLPGLVKAAAWNLEIEEKLVRDIKSFVG